MRQVCLAELVKPGKMYCARGGAVLEWEGSEPVAMPCTPHHDCCSAFLADAIACCKDKPGFVLEKFLQSYHGLTCEVAVDGVRARAGTVSLRPHVLEEAPRLDEGERDDADVSEASEVPSACRHMNLELHCPGEPLA